MGGTEQTYIQQAFDVNWISTAGPQINAFEDKLASFTGNQHAAVLASGTAAIHLALRILGINKGDSVICQTFTFAGSAFPITYQGAQPIFIDSEPDTWNMDPNILEDSLKRITASPHQRPKAIIPVHLYGMPAKMDEIRSLAAKYDIPIIEDAAEALGSIYHGQPAGSLGDMGILSFNGNKIITTSGGGALLSNNREYIEKAKFLATQARDPAPHYEHTQIGYNYRMGNINAAIGLGQMEVLDERVKRKREIWQFYYNELSEFFEFQALEDSDNQIDLPDRQAGTSTNKHSVSNRWLTTIVTESFTQRESIRLALEKANIESRPLWKPMHLQPVFKDAQYFGGKVAEDLFERGLCLPSGTAMTEVDLERVVKIVKDEVGVRR